MRRIATLLLLLPLLFAAPAGAESWRGELVGPSVAADAQVLEATLVALRIPLQGVEETASWTLEGASLEAVTRVQVTDRGEPPDLDQPPDPDDPAAVVGPREHEERGIHQDFLARVTRAGPGAVYVLPHPDGAATLERSIGPVELVPSTDDAVDPGNDAPAHQPSRDTSRTVFLEDRDPPVQYVVQGDLLLDVSSMDWEVEDRNGTTTYRSGRTAEPLHDEAPDGAVAKREEDRHLFLYVRDGTLRLPGHGLRPDLYLDDVRLESQRLDLRAATGVLAVGDATLRLEGEAVEFRDGGRLTGVRSTGRLLSYEAVAGGAVLVGGEPVAAPAVPVAGLVAVPDGGSSPAWLLLPVLAWFLVRPPFWLVAFALRLRLRRFAARHAPRFLASVHARPAALVGAVALLGLHRFEAARAFLARVPEAAKPRDGTWSYLQAHASAGAGDDAAAADHLEQCLEAAPEHGPQVLANPVLRRVAARWPERFRRFLAPLPA